MNDKKYGYTSVLTIAGSDSGGGAGIQADIKTFSALGCFGTSAVTAITVQNTVGVTGIHSIPEDIVCAQIEAVMNDIKPKAIKIGMIHTASLVKAIAKTLEQYPDVPIIVDPVMIATSGDKLVENDVVESLKMHLFKLATVVTPNLDEAALLTGKNIADIESMKAAAQIILQTGCRSVLIKGGHLKTKKIADVWISNDNETVVIESNFIQTNNLHGTGCTLSSAIAAFLAMGNEVQEAIQKAHDYVYTAIDNGKDAKTGNGNGPLNHFFNPMPLRKTFLQNPE